MTSRPLNRNDAAALCLGIYGATTLIAMAVMSIGLLALAAGYFFAFRSWKEVREGFGQVPRTWPTRTYHRAAVLLLAALVVSLAAAWLFPVRIGEYVVQVSPRDFLKAWYLFLPLLLWRLGSALPEKSLAKALRIWLGACAVLSVVGVFQHFTGWPRNQPIPYLNRYHAILWLGHHLSVASIWIFPAFTALALATKREGPKWIGLSRPVLGGIAVLAFTTLFLTYSRMLWLALPVGFAAFPLLYFRNRKALALLGLIVTAIAGLSQVPDVRQRLALQMGRNERFELWAANAEFFKMRPLFGIGWHKPGALSGPYLEHKYPERKEVFASHAHNNFLEVLAGTGIFGLLAWLCWSFTVFWILWRYRNAPGLSTFFPGLFSAWIVFHLNGLTQVNFWEGKVLHQMMWATGLSLVLAAAASRKLK